MMALIAFGVGVLMVAFFVVMGLEKKKNPTAQCDKKQEVVDQILRDQRKAQMENLRQHRFVVYVREKDGRKSSFEALLIAELIRQQLAVEYLPESDWQAIIGGDLKLLADGRLALIGTSWHRSRRQDPDWHAGSESEFTYCDYRLLAAVEDGRGQILAASCVPGASYWGEHLANRIVEKIAETMFPAKAS